MQNEEAGTFLSALGNAVLGRFPKTHEAVRVELRTVLTNTGYAFQAFPCAPQAWTVVQRRVADRLVTDAFGCRWAPDYDDDGSRGPTVITARRAIFSAIGRAVHPSGSGALEAMSLAQGCVDEAIQMAACAPLHAPLASDMKFGLFCRSFAEALRGEHPEYQLASKMGYGLWRVAVEAVALHHLLQGAPQARTAKWTRAINFLEMAGLVYWLPPRKEGETVVECGCRPATILRALFHTIEMAPSDESYARQTAHRLLKQTMEAARSKKGAADNKR